MGRTQISRGGKIRNLKGRHNGGCYKGQKGWSKKRRERRGNRVKGSGEESGKKK